MSNVYSPPVNQPLYNCYFKFFFVINLDFERWKMFQVFVLPA